MHTCICIQKIIFCMHMCIYLDAQINSHDELVYYTCALYNYGVTCV